MRRSNIISVNFYKTKPTQTRLHFVLDTQFGMLILAANNWLFKKIFLNVRLWTSCHQNENVQACPK